MLNEYGQITIPLYHGTSSIFLESIKKFGLGGVRDPQLFDMNILAALADSLKSPKNKTEWWELNSTFIEPMLEQRITCGGYNFRYGGTYLTPSKLIACNYASGNNLGSELLTTIYGSFNALNSVNKDEANRIIPTNHKLRSMFGKEHTPALITVMNLSTEKLRTEKGERIEKQIDSMLKMKQEMPGLNPELLWQQFNFELDGIVKPELLTVALINQV